MMKQDFAAARHKFKMNIVSMFCLVSNICAVIK